MQITQTDDMYLVSSQYYDPSLKTTMVDVLGAQWDRALKAYIIPRNQATSYIMAEQLKYTDTHGFPVQNGYDLSHVTTPMWDHQKAAVALAMQHKRYMLAMDMGTGKSLCAVAVTGAVRAKLTLILCPKSVVNVWPRQYMEHSGISYTIIPLDGSTLKKKVTMYDMVRQARGDKSLVFICNYESIWRGALGEYAASVPFDMLILDESHKLKSHAYSAKASRYVHSAFSKVPYKLALTGSPMPHSPVDIWAQYKILNAGIFGSYFGKFRDRYCEMGGFHKTKILGYQKQAEFKRRVHLISYRVKKEECLDLPPEVDEMIELTLPDKLKKDYARLEEDFFLQVRDGVVTAANAVVKMMRLRQFISGFAKLDAHPLPVPVHDLKAQALSDILQGTKEKVTVFCTFKYDLEVVKNVASTLHLKYGEVSGSANDLNKDAQYPRDIDVLGVQIQSGGIGIDLSRSSVGVYYSIGLSLGDYVQSRARLHRPGQKNKVTFIHLLVKNTLDIKIHKALMSRRDVIEEILTR